MLKHHKKLKKLWRNCEVLSAMAGKTLTTKEFDKEFFKVIQQDVLKENSGRKQEEALFKNLISTFLPFKGNR